MMELEQITTSMPQSRRVLATIAVVAALASIGFLRLAVSTSAVGTVLIWLTLGALAGVIALGFGARLLSLVEDPTQTTTRIALCGVAITALGVALAHPIVAPFGLALLMLVWVAVYRFSTGPSSAWSPRLLVVGVVLLGIAVALLTHSAGAAAAGVVVWVVGLAAIKFGLAARLRVESNDEEEWTAATSRRGWIAVGVGVLVSLAGAGLLRFSPDLPDVGDGPVLEVIGATAIVAGLSVAAIAALHASPRGDQPPVTLRGWLGLLLLGLGLAVAGIAETRDVLPLFTGLFVAVVLIAVGTGIFFVLRGESIAFMVLLGFLVAWVFVDRTEPADTRAQPEGAIVALGDSFSSGQGSDRYTRLTNTQSPEGNTCRRSPVAYAELVGAQLNRTVYNWACNGARIEHLERDGQKDDPAGEAQVPGSQPQLHNVGRSDFSHAPDDVELVLMSIGGNDVSFSKVVAACVLPSACDEAGDLFEAEVALIIEELRTAYGAVLDRFPSADVVILPYPAYAGTTTCGAVSITKAELEFADRFIGRLNSAIFDVVTGFGGRDGDRLHFFTGMEAAYAGRRLCEEPQAANHIRLVPTGGSVTQRLNPTTWHEATMHPNDLGHECTAKALTDFLAEHVPQLRPSADGYVPPPLGCALGEPGNPVPGELEFDDLDHVAYVADPDGERCVADPDDGECFDTGAWTAGELRTTASRLVVPVSLMLVGGMLIAIGAVRSGRAPELFDPFLPDRPLHDGGTRAARGGSGWRP